MYMFDYALVYAYAYQASSKHVACTTFTIPRHLSAHYLESLSLFSLVVCFCTYYNILKAIEMRFGHHFRHSALSFTMALLQLLAFAVFLSALVGRAAPFMDKKVMEEMQERLKRLREVPGFDPDEYKRYWDEMLKNDPRQMDRLKELRKARGMDEDLQKMMENRPMFGDRMARSAEDVRTRLDEARRVNVEEMRQLQRLQAMRDAELMKDGDWMTRREAMRENLPPHFTNQDLHARLEKQQKILADLDKQRQEEFRRYEMQMEHRRREKLREMDSEHRAKAEKEFQDMQKKLKDHEHLRHPASKEQLEDVWEHQDGLNKEDFDPKTFFHLHDKNGDRHLDAMELEALFYSELKKVYKDNPGGMEAHEDLARMREHAFSELDRDRDGMVSLEEFLGYTKSDEYKTDEEWKPVVDQDDLFSEDDFKKFEDNYDDDYYDYEYDDDGNIVGFKTKHDKKPEDDNAKVNDHSVPPSAAVPSAEPAKPEEPAKQDKQPPPPEKILQIDDPKAVHIDAAEAVNKDKPSEGEKEGGEKVPPKPADLPDPKANQL